MPVPGGPGTYLRDVAGRSSGDVWAVGAAQSGPLLVRLDGRAWNAVGAGPRNGLLQAIDLPWAVGTQGETGPTSSEDPLVMRLLGGRWRVAATPHLDTVDENLLAVDAVWTQVAGRPGSLSDLSALSAHDIWAVGSNGSSGFVERYACR